jgi:hypothetical protein
MKRITVGAEEDLQDNPNCGAKYKWPRLRCRRFLRGGTQILRARGQVRMLLQILLLLQLHGGGDRGLMIKVVHKPVSWRPLSGKSVHPSIGAVGTRNFVQ